MGHTPAAHNVEKIIGGIRFDAYVGDLLRESATERQLQNLGEALGRLRRCDPEVAQRVPNVHKIIGMRNVLVHGYATVNSRTVWAAATIDVPGLIPLLQQLLEELARE
ncbi:HepT-like ribonuclease domain-containing protein [Millisia brevis]|uniref:HepT-like ribonuclease domain-containing protein n=1 Tax=Millisia brevis TaxID=264148 RepID=UPI001C3F1D14